MNDRLNSTVTVLADSSNEHGGHIVTFSQFWLGALALTLGTLLANLLFVYPIARAIKRM